MSTNFKENCINILSKIRPGSTFLGIRGYMNNYGEVADYNICFHVDYENALKKSISILESFSSKDENLQGKSFSYQDLDEARIDLLDSFKRSLVKKASQSKNKEAYAVVRDQNNNPIPGIRIHTKDDIIHLHGLLLSKKVIITGNYPNGKQQSKTGMTEAKKLLRNKTPLGKFVQFKLAPHRFERLVVDNMIIRGI